MTENLSVNVFRIVSTTFYAHANTPSVFLEKHVINVRVEISHAFHPSLIFLHWNVPPKQLLRHKEMELEVHSRHAIPLLIVLKVTIVVSMMVEVPNTVMEKRTASADPIFQKMSAVHVMNLIVFL